MVCNNFSDILLSEELSRSMREKIPWRGRVNPDEVGELFSWQAVNEMIFFQRLDRNRLRLSRGADLPSGNENVFHNGVDGFGFNADYLLVNALHAALEGGATAIIESVNESSYVLNKITEDIFNKYYARSTINSYMSFGSTSGFGAHFDDQDVIIIQVDGIKRWSFFEDGESNYANAHSLSDPRKADVLDQIFLEKGDVLYIPKGIWHDVSSIGEPSLHLAIGLSYPSIADFISWLVGFDEHGAGYEDIHPFGFDAEHVADKVNDFFGRLCTPKMVNKFLVNYCSEIGGVRIRPDVYHRFSFVESDVFLRVPSVLLRAGVDGDAKFLRMRALGRIYDLSIEEINLLAKFDSSYKLTYHELLKSMPDGLSMENKNEILADMLKKGVITKANDVG